MQGFEFQPGDAEALAKLCEHVQKKAKNSPCHFRQEAADPKFSFGFGNWHLSLTQDAWTLPVKWHASAAVMEEVGETQVVLDSGIIAAAPQDALVAVQSWSDELSKQADYLLGELMAPFITKSDQRVEVMDGLFARHLLTNTNLK